MGDNSNFVHLHCHSTYSIQDALPFPADLAYAADSMGFPAVALTDHGRMSGAVEFVDACRKTPNKIKPIIGLEVYTCANMYDKTTPPGRKRPKHNHLTLLAQNKKGYTNLLAITSIAAEKGYYYNPRVDFGVLQEHAEGLIVLSGCLASEVNQFLLNDDYDSALAAAKKFQNLYKDNFYIELQYHGIEDQKHNLQPLIDISREISAPLVCTNDVHYIYKEDAAARDVLQQMRDLRENKQYVPPKHNVYSTKQFYLKPYDAMFKTFGSKVPEALENTVAIANKVEDYLQIDVPPMLPKAIIPENDDFKIFKEDRLPYHDLNDAYLAYLSFEGLKKKKLDQNPIYIKRLKKELSQIWYMGVTDYFLIYNEIVTYMKNNKIMYGVRGSGVASLVNYCLGICPIDPVRWDLLFERFLNPGRGTQYDLQFHDLQFDYDAKYDNTEAQRILKELVQDALKRNKQFKKFTAHISKELWVIGNQELANYYLELVNAKISIEKNKPNSYLAYALGITPEKPTGSLVVKKVATLPDIDTDVDDSKRDQVIGWMRERFGYDKVVNIAAWGTLAARASVLGALKTSEKFNAKYKDNPHAAALKITATIPKKPGTTIDEGLLMSSDFAYYHDRFPDEIDIAKELYGKINNLSIHAAGVIVSGCPVVEHAPIESSKGTACSGYKWEIAERVGLPKYDILGLKTLRMLDIAVAFVKARHGVELDLDELDFDDPKIYKHFRNGQTATVFQFGSPGMQDTLRQVKASSMEDLIAVVALYRPGPLDYIPDYAQRKLGKKEYTFEHPLLEKHLATTYGIIVYQEQAMRLTFDMGKFSWTEVDKLRKAISKKSGKDFDASLNLFRERSLKYNIPEYVVEETIKLMSTFGGYAFNRGHATSYAALAYKTAYMLTYYPAEWIAACIETDIDKDDDILKYLDEAKNFKINVLYPDVNYSEMTTAINENNEIVLPLNFCKGAGSLAQAIADNKPYDSFEDLLLRVRPSKTVIKALTSGNAFKSLPDVANLDFEDIMAMFDDVAKRSKKDAALAKKISNQKSITATARKQEPCVHKQTNNILEGFFNE
jgi:DNA polymerase III alpha subunit